MEKMKEKKFKMNKIMNLNNKFLYQGFIPHVSRNILFLIPVYNLKEYAKNKEYNINFDYWSYNIPSFIHDLHVILYIDRTVPWNDKKYKKRISMGIKKKLISSTNNELNILKEKVKLIVEENKRLKSILDSKENLNNDNNLGKFYQIILTFYFHHLEILSL